MIINFSIKNFRSIKDEITLSFEAAKDDKLEEYYIYEPQKGLRLLKLGLIYGANASGKTNILEALNLLHTMIVNPLPEKTKKFDVEPFLFDAKSAQENTKFSLEFIQKGTRYLYNIEFNKNAVLEEELYFFKPNKARVYLRKSDIEKQLTTIDFGSKIKMSRENKIILTGNTLWNNSVLGGYLKTNIESEELQEVSTWFSGTLEYMITPKTDLADFVSNMLLAEEFHKRDVLEILKKADFGISDIRFEQKESQLSADALSLIAHTPDMVEKVAENIAQNGIFKGTKILFRHQSEGDSCELPYEDESAGTQRYYQLAGVLSLMIRESLIVPIDELEASLHPDLFKHFLLAFLANAKGSQLIATTHHRELLLEKDILRTDAIWFTEKQENGSTDLFSLDDFDSSVVRETTSFYNKYKVGKLGATPHLGDYFIGEDDGTE